MLHAVPVELELSRLPQIRLTEVSLDCAAIAIVADAASPSGYRIVLAPEMTESPLRLDILEEMATALTAVVADLKLLGAKARM